MTVAALAKPAQPSAKPNRWLVTLSVSFGTLMGAVDASIVNVALPHIRGAVGATVHEITWISTSYAIALVIVMPLTAFLSRLFGQKRVYMFCLGLFLLGSVACAFAGSLVSLVLFRALQGLGAGALQPTEQAILRQTFPPEEQGMAMALFAMAVMLGPALGPTLGGYIVDHWHWSWIFLINLPIGIIGLSMVGAFVHEDEELRERNRALAVSQRGHVDWSGILLLSAGLSLLTYVLEEGASQDWFESRLVCTCLGVGLLCLALFVARELTARAPAVNLRLFRDPVFTSGTLIGAVMFAMLMANMFLLPIFMQELLGFSATQSGVALMPRTLVMMVAVPIVGRLYNRVSPRLLIAIGIAFIAAGSLDQSQLTLQSTARDVIVALGIQGVGFACLFVPLTTVALANIPRHQLSDATGLNSLLRQIGGAVGLAVFVTLLDNFAAVARVSVSSHVTELSPATAQRLELMTRGFVHSGLDLASSKAAALLSLQGLVSRQAMVLAFEKVFLISGFMFIAIVPLLLLLKKPKNAPRAASALEH
jgi:MFS transporter, DHA2 family, multidrug resistance protein